jgi:epoxide hydrolase-like predicted phosphatase
LESPTGLIADFGGVLTSSVLDSFNRWCEEYRVEFSELLQALTTSSDGTDGSPLHLIEVGEIEEEEFSRLLSKALSRSDRPVPQAGLKESLFADVRPEPSMVEVIARVRRAGIATCLLSNSWGSGSDYPHDVLETLFDEMIFSAQVGIRKPDEKIYLLAAEKIDKDPTECVFIDDLKVNVKSAEAVGMTGILHQEASVTVARLEEIFAGPLEWMS